MDLKSRFVNVAGRRCRFVRTGAGPSLVLVASPLILATTYRPLLERLAWYYTVYAVEVPGSGRSARLSTPWSYDEYADWLASFFETLKIPSATVIGHSNSGAIAIAFARRCPERVDRLVLADSIGVRARGGSLPRALFARALDALLEIRLTLTGWPHLLYNLIFHTRNFLHQVRVAPKVDLRAELPDVQSRTLIAWGGRDNTLPRDCARSMQRAIAQASYVVSPKGSHDWLIERPAEFTDILSVWAKRTSNGREDSVTSPAH